MIIKFSTMNIKFERRFDFLAKYLPARMCNLNNLIEQSSSMSKTFLSYCRNIKFNNVFQQPGNRHYFISSMWFVPYKFFRQRFWKFPSLNLSYSQKYVSY